MQLYGKTALITGAGQGIGRATAVAFAKEGANLILADINYENAVETANQIADKNIQCWPYKLDVSDVNQINSLINFAVEKCDGIDLFFNNAGVTQHISFFDIKKLFLPIIFFILLLNQRVCQQMRYLFVLILPRQKGENVYFFFININERNR